MYVCQTLMKVAMPKIEIKKAFLSNYKMNV